VACSPSDSSARTSVGDEIVLNGTPMVCADVPFYGGLVASLRGRDAGRLEDKNAWGGRR